MPSMIFGEVKDLQIEKLECIIIPKKQISLSYICKGYKYSIIAIYDKDEESYLFDKCSRNGMEHDIRGTVCCSKTLLSGLWSEDDTRWLFAVEL